MAYRVEITASAERNLARLAPDVRRRVLASIYALSEVLRPPGTIKLAGSARDWRIRVGDYRVIYEIRDDSLVVLVVEVGHRREVYRRR